MQVYSYFKTMPRTSPFLSSVTSPEFIGILMYLELILYILKSHKESYYICFPKITQKKMCRHLQG